MLHIPRGSSVNSNFAAMLARVRVRVRVRARVRVREEG